METYILRGVTQIHADNMAATFDNKDGVFIRNRFLKRQSAIEGVYSPSPEYPAACRSGAEIPPSGAAGMISLRCKLRLDKKAR